MRFIFSVRLRQKVKTLKTIVHIPHSSTIIPSDLLDQFLLSAPELERELILMTDAFTEELYAGLPSAIDVVFPVSRIVLDPERFENDSDEPMAARGMGIVYQRTSQQEPLRRTLSPGERASVIARFYRPHHKRLESEARRVLAEHGRCLILDGHSFPSRALPYEIDASLPRPEICIGTDEFHTPPGLCAAAERLFGDAGFEVGVNVPFAGALVPATFYRSERNVHALMIEVRRDMYMNEVTGKKTHLFDAIKGRLRKVLQLLVRYP